MKAITLKDFGGVENLQLQEVPVPTIADGEILVRVKAISINPVDVKTRSGKNLAAKLKAFNPIILGWDIAGIVEETNSPLFKKGDEVFGMVNFPGHGQAYAEYVAAPAAHVALKPANISFAEAAAACVAGLTAWETVVERAQVKAPQKVLIHAAGGGVGHYAVQMAKHVGAYVIGTSSAANKDFVLGLGADEHIDYKSQQLTNVVSNVDFVLDSIGDDNIDESLLVMKTGGTIISLPSGHNEKVAEKAAAKGMIGYPILIASNDEKMKKIAALLQQGSIRSHVSKTFPLADMAQAHLQVETGKTVGKVIVLVD